MASKVTVERAPFKPKPYEVSGSTLAEIWDDIKAKGPKDGGKPRAGYTKAKAEMVGQMPFDGKIVTDKKSGAFQVEVWPKQIKFKVLVDMQVPKLKSDKELSDKAKKEWKRFRKELLSHEEEHIAETEKETKKFGGEVLKLRGKAEDADKEAAKKAAVEAFEKEQGKKHTKAQLDARLDKVNKDLDKSGHGPVLNTSIP